MADDPFGGDSSGGGGGAPGVAVGALYLPIATRGLADALKDLDRLDKTAAAVGAKGFALPVSTTGVIGAIKGLDDLGGASEAASAATRDLSAAQATQAETSGAALSADQKRAAQIEAITADLAAQAQAIDVRSKVELAAFNRNAQAAQKALGNLHAEDAAYEQVANAMLVVTERTAALGEAQAAQTGTAEKSGAAIQKVDQRVRSGANALAVLAIAATQGTGSLQSIALAGGLAAGSLSHAFGTEKITAWSAGIGAAVTIAAVLVGVLEKATEAEKPTQAFLDHLQHLDAGQATAAIAQVRAETEKTRDAAIAADTWLGRMLHRRPDSGKGFVTDLSRDLVDSFGLDRLGLTGSAERAAIEGGEKINALTKQQAEQRVAETKASMDATTAALTAGLDRQAQATIAATKIEEAANTAAHDRGLKSDAAYYAERQRLARVASQATIASLDGELELTRQRRTKSDAERIQQANDVLALESRISQERQNLTATEIGLENDLRKATDARVASEIAALATLEPARRLEVADYTHAVALQERLNAELGRGNVTLERRAQIETQLRQLASAGLAVTASQFTLASTPDTVTGLPTQENAGAGLPQITAGVTAAGEQLRKHADQTLLDTRQALKDSFADAIAGGIGDGIEAGFAGLFQGGIGEGFKDLGKALAGGIGHAMVELGKGVLLMSKLMAAAKEALKTLNPVAGAVAGVLLIAAGTALQAAAGGMFNSGGGGGGAGYSASAPSGDTLTRVDLTGGLGALTPWGASRTASPTMTVRGDPTPATPPPATNNTFNVFGNTPEVQRFISEVQTAGHRRGLDYPGGR